MLKSGPIDVKNLIERILKCPKYVILHLSITLLTGVYFFFMPND